MKTITIDDRRAVVNMMRRMLKKIDPDGVHEGSTDPEEVLARVGTDYYDVAFIDVEMPSMNGIDLARKLIEIEPLINIIFITGYEEYMPQAFEMYASGYLMKPVTEEDVVGALAHLRYRTVHDVHKSRHHNVKVRCFGTFEVYVDEMPVHFHRSKCKEMFAFLVDRKGAVCSNDMMIEALWPDKEMTASLKSLERTVAAEMIRDMNELGAGDVIIHNNGEISVNTNRVDCDYYDYLSGDPFAIHSYEGQYMIQYEFAKKTRESLSGRRAGNRETE